MSKLYSSPLRVYLLLGFLAAVGIYSGFHLPISLFPNSSKPVVIVNIPYGSYAADEWLNTFGKSLETQLRNISTERVDVEKIEATYSARRAKYNILFKWGVKPTEALKETQNVVNSFTARLSDESRDGTWCWLDTSNSGFFALSFYSDVRDLDSLYDIIEPALGAKLSSVKDAQNPILWNPSSKEVRVELYPEAVASLGLFPRDIEAAVQSALANRTGGTITVGVSQLQIEMPRQVQRVDEFNQIPVPAPSGKVVHLSEIAHIDLGPKTMGNQSFKTSGAPSLILYTSPKPGGNVKKMSEDMLALVKELMPQLPKDVKYRVLVDPSEFIRSAVNNVFHEVAIAALLAVCVLFLFIGSFRNVITAAIEIPLSMVLAFIMMRLFGMNLNLISLGGLALSAGMNVDGSVVVMENIFRHFEMHPGPHSFASRLSILTRAVAEVRFAIIASTVASLVVFIPLTLTSGLSYAILGDLALAVVFSHGISAFVALILVPTVRLQLMSLPGGEKAVHSPIERQLKALENTYSSLLGKFLARPRLKWSAYAGLTALLALLALVVLPRLPKEVVGKPDTDWMVLGVGTQGNTLLRQMEVKSEEVEKSLLNEFGSHILYTFNEINDPNSATIMARLKDKREMRDLWKKLEARFQSTPTTSMYVGPWNPSEMPIPDPPQMKIAVRGGDLVNRALTAQSLDMLMRDNKVFPQLQVIPDATREAGIFITPHVSQWTALRAQGVGFTSSDLADLLRVATTGRRIGLFPRKNEQTEIVLRYPTNRVGTLEQVGALPIGIGSKIVPLKALATPQVRNSLPTIYRENSRDLFTLTGREERGDEYKATADLAKAKKLVADWDKERTKAGTSPISVAFEDPAEDLNEAIHQLTSAAVLSVGLIFLVLMLQFGSLMESLLVLVSVPLGLIGVLLSLWVFRSTLSLNSILGVILLNGIAVANSIILVDFIKRLVQGGMEPVAAAVEAARTRLRPILITSLTTVLGMLPVALGLGEGGHILQPLGIAVAGGLWVSMGLTLFLVPSLQVSYLEWRQRDRAAGYHLRWPSWLHLPRLRRPATETLTIILVFFSPALIASPEPLTYEQALQAIIDRNIDVGSQKATLEQVKARNLPSHLSLLPSVSLEGRIDSRRDNQLLPDFATGGVTQQAVTTNRFGGVARGELNLFRFGGDVASMRAANSEERSQAGYLDDTILKTETTGARAIDAVLQAEKELEILRRSQELRQKVLEAARERFRRGLMAEQEVSKVEVDFSNDRATFRDTESESIRTRAELVALLGHDNVQREWPWRERLSAGTPKILGLGDSVLANRPDWQAAQAKLTGARQRQTQSLAKVLPSLDLVGSYGYVRSDSQGTSITGPELSAGLVLSIPLFDRLQNYGAYAAQVQTVALAELDFEKTKRAARAEWDAARGALDVSLQTAKDREHTLELARRVYGDNLTRFKRGLASVNDLSVDQARLILAERLAVQGWSGAHTNFVRLCNAVGRRVKDCWND